MRGYPKVTGKRGIQVWIRVRAGYTFDQTREWVGGLSRGVGAVVPDLVSWEWSKADRGGRARLDYTQNSFIKTLVAPYAVRPVPSGAVSAPIGWDELDDPELAAGRWDMRSIIERVARKGDLFAGVLGDPQELPPLGCGLRRGQSRCVMALASRNAPSTMRTTGHRRRAPATSVRVSCTRPMRVRMPPGMSGHQWFSARR